MIIRGVMMKAFFKPAALIFAGCAIGFAVAWQVAPRAGPVPYRQIEADAGLDRIVDRVEFRDEPLEEAIAKLAEQTHTNITITRRELEGESVDVKMPIRLTLHGVPLRSVIDEIIRQANAFRPPIAVVGYEASDGIIRITACNQLWRQPVTRMYDVSDLVLRRPPMVTTSTSGASGVLFGNAAPSPQIVGDIDDLMRLIMNLVEPDVWRDDGGPQGAIYGFGTTLVITQTPPNHDRIATLLNGLRHPKEQ